MSWTSKPLTIDKTQKTIHVSSTFRTILLLLSLTSLSGCDAIAYRVNAWFSPPNQQRTLAMMADLEAKGDIPRAISIGEDFIQRAPDVSEDVRFELVRLHTITGNVNAAVRLMAEHPRASAEGSTVQPTRSQSGVSATVSEEGAEASAGSVRARVGN